MQMSSEVQLRLALASSLVTAIGVVYLALEASEANTTLKRMEARQIEAEEKTMQELEAEIDGGDA